MLHQKLAAEGICDKSWIPLFCLLKRMRWRILYAGVEAWYK